MNTRPSSENELSVCVDADGRVHILDANSGKVFTYNSRFRLAQTAQLSSSTAGAKNHFGSVAVGPSGSLYVSDISSNRVLRLNGDGRVVSEISAGARGTGQDIAGEFAVTNNYIFSMDAGGLVLHVWTTDGKSKLDIDLAPELGQAHRLPPPVAVSPRGELLVLDAPEKCVLRYRINF